MYKKRIKFYNEGAKLYLASEDFDKLETLVKIYRSVIPWQARRKAYAYGCMAIGMADKLVPYR